MSFTHITVERDYVEALYGYLDAYFKERDLTKTVTFFSDVFTGFGTAMDEAAFKHNDFLERTKRYTTKRIKNTSR